jgi:cysteine-rich CPCC protein
MLGRMESFPCPCCGHVTFSEPPGSYEICSICVWEDDISQLRFPLMGRGANGPSLLEAQRNFGAFGSSEYRLFEHCRPPTSDEPLDEGWRTMDVSADNPEIPTPGVDYGGTYPTDPTALYYWRATYWRRSR